MVTDAESLSFSLLTLRETTYSPSAKYVCKGLGESELFPSPNSHSLDVAFSEKSLNLTERGGMPSVTSEVKRATGSTGGAGVYSIKGM